MTLKQLCKLIIVLRELGLHDSIIIYIVLRLS